MVLLDGINEELFCSFIYASNYVEERKELWEDLRNHQDSPLFRDKPWLILGDFNEIIDMEEHSGFLDSQTPLGMRDFQDVVRYNSLEDMASHAPQFTWCSKREEGLVCKKLDHVLMSEAWHNLYPQSYSAFEAGGLLRPFKMQDSNHNKISAGSEAVQIFKRNHRISGVLTFGGILLGRD